MASADAATRLDTISIEGDVGAAPDVSSPADTPDVPAPLDVRDVPTPLDARDVPTPLDVVDSGAADSGTPYPLPPRFDPSGASWAATDAGTWIAASTVGLRLVYDRTLRDPSTAFARCSHIIRYCVRQPGRGLDDCVASAPRCATATPWMEERDCCPPACAVRFAALRSAGRERFAAFVDVFADHPDCFPGLGDGGAP